READGLHVVHATHAQPAFHDVSRHAEIVLPIGHEGYAAEMSSRGVTADIEAVTVTNEFLSTSVGPGDAAAYLFAHNTELTAGLLYCNEIKRNVVRASIHNHLARKCVILCLSTKPSSTVNKHEDRRFRAFGPIDIEFLDGCRAVRLAHRLTDATAHRLARGSQTVYDF